MEAQNLKKYGVPLYSVDWVPYKSIQFHPKSQDEPDQAQPTASKNYVVLAGGGGEGSSGIPNAVLLSEFDIESSSLSDQPVNFQPFFFLYSFLILLKIYSLLSPTPLFFPFLFTFSEMGFSVYVGC